MSDAVEVRRGDLVESRHAVSVAVTDADGRLVAAVGDVDGAVYYRSAAKPLQALPLVTEGVAERFGLTTEELSVCCASHEAEAFHLEAVRSILAKAGVDEERLRCGPHPPFSPATTRDLAAEGLEPTPIHNNCSGKHAGMLALATAMGWSLEDYHRPDHPVQQRMRAEVAHWTGLDPVRIAAGIDGCGVVCFGVPLRVMAASFARFSASAHAGEPPATIVAAMTDAPRMVGGTGRTCTDVMDRTAGRAWVKLGAEGVYGGGIPAEGLGLAIKVADGGRRAVEVALVRVLEELGVLGPEDTRALGAHGRPVLRNTRGEEVGEITAAFTLQRSPAAASRVV